MIHICKNNKMNRFLEKYIEEFIQLKGYKVIGIDFEFNRIKNKREIALCQINFEIDRNADSDIFLFYPPNISKHIFQKLLISDNIIKILHGGESLDIPYLFDYIIDEPNRIIFCDNLFDTRYMCEYYNSTNNINGKCKIYDLLLQMKVITLKEYNMLDENDKKMGNIWEIHIDVNNMSKELAQYSVYDVKYLPALYHSFPRNAVYDIIIPGLACVNFILRYNNTINDLFADVSKYNLNKYENYNITYSEIYTAVFYWLVADAVLYSLISINYFKKFFEILIKSILYSKLNTNINIQYSKIYQSKMIKFINNIESHIMKML